MMKVITLNGGWKVIWLAIALLTVGLLGCAPAAPERPAAPAEKPPGAALTPAAPQPKYGGTLAYMGTSSANTLNPYITAGPQDRRTVGPIYENLVRFNYKVGVDHRIDYQTTPWLAEGWEQPNETTYIFRIRKGIKWHDGQDFTADDVVFSYDYARDPKNAFVVADLLYAINTVEVTDKYTVKITTKGPAADLLTNLADENMMVLPKHVFDRGDKFEKVAIGTGPFKLEEYKAGALGKYSRNDNYWQTGKPYPKGIETYYGLDRPTTVSAFIAKKFDLLHIEDQRQLDTVLSSLPDIKYGTAYGDYGYSIIMKLDKPPFNDIRVRKAMHLAIDRQALIKTAGLGNAIANPPGVLGFMGSAIPQEELLKLPGYRQPKDEDLAEAKRLLTEAGYPNGFKSRTAISTASTSSRRLSEPVAGQLLKNVGIELTLEGTEQSVYLTQIQKGNYDAAMVLGAGSDWDYQWNYLHSKGTLNKMGINDPKLDEYLEAQKFVLDVEKRKKAAIDMQRLLLEKLYYIPTIELGFFPAWQPWVHDYYYNPGASPFQDIQTVSTIWMDVDKMPADRR